MAVDFNARVAERLDRFTWTRAELDQSRTEALREQVRWAKEKSAFYRRRLAGVDADRIGLDDLVDIEATTKADVLEYFDDIACEPGVTLAGCEAHVAGMTGPGPMNGLHVFATSSSSGRPGFGVLTDDEWRDNLAGLVGGLMRHVLNGSRNASAGGSVMFSLAGGSPAHMSAATLSAIAEVFPDWTIESMPASTPIERVVECLDSFRPNRVGGFPSALDQLAGLQLEGAIDLDLEDLSCAGEPLTLARRERLRAAFGIDPVDRYGASETGWLASSHTPSDSSMMLHEDEFVFEPVDASHAPAAPGEEGSALLVTPLRRRAFPLIRYELTDRVQVLPAEPARAGPYNLLRAVEGRNDDWFRYGSIAIHPTIFTSALTDIPGIREFQVRQSDLGAVILVCGDLTADRASGLVARLRTELGDHGLVEPNIDVRLVDRIEPTLGLKHRAMVPLGNTSDRSPATRATPRH